MLNIKAATLQAAAVKADIWVVGLTDAGSQKLGPLARWVDEKTQGLIRALIRDGDFTGKATETLFIPKAVGGQALLLVGLGSPNARHLEATRALKLAAQNAATALSKTTAQSACVFWPQAADGSSGGYEIGRFLTESLCRALYQIPTKRSAKQKPLSPPKLKTVTLIIAASQRKPVQAGIDFSLGIAAGIKLAKDLANLPGNMCTPTYLANQARQLAKQYRPVTATVYDRKAIERFNMGSFLAVAQGSAEPPQLIVLEYRGARASEAPVALIGKGITFDTGGISLKDPAAMDEMKFDMSGAASVIGCIKALAECQAAVNVVAIVPSCENMPDGKAIKPGDIVTAMNGTSIEILNTDAEGRLILCDALHFAKRFKPKAMIDVATLTGACVIALGSVVSGLFSNNDSLADELLEAGTRAGDLAWRMPLGEEYSDMLKSNFADVANIGGREAGAVTAACFLWKFVDDIPWAHLDIAGTAWLGGAQKGATGRPVSLLVEYLTLKG
jgi:leucyl aminopeptidase